MLIMDTEPHNIFFEASSWTRCKDMLLDNIENTWPRNSEATGAQWPLLLTWFNFNPSMDK